MATSPPYSFAKSESVASFSSQFDCFKHFVFDGDVAKARAVLADQAAGLVAAMPAVLPEAKASAPQLAR
jgi:hypothetical protein